MRGRRILYLIALLSVAAFHLAYGQYISHYMFWFVLLLPALSLLVSLPAILSTRVTLIGGEDVSRDRPCAVRLSAVCASFLPLDCLKVRLEEKNLFLDERPKRTTHRLIDLSEAEQAIPLKTDCIGTVRCSIRSAWAYDYLGFFMLPVRKGAAVTLTVLPAPTAPKPMPTLIDPSEQALKPKPQGFSEEHELRPYRPGDSINLIHWKLSSKFDDTIIREPQELQRRNIVLAVDLPDSYVMQESLLDQLAFLTDTLMAMQIPYTLYIGLKTVSIRSDGEFKTFLKTFLSEPLHAEPTPAIRTGNDTLVVRLTPGEGVAA